MWESEPFRMLRYCRNENRISLGGAKYGRSTGLWNNNDVEGPSVLVILCGQGGGQGVYFYAFQISPGVKTKETEFSVLTVGLLLGPRIPSLLLGTHLAYFSEFLL